MAARDQRVAGQVAELAIHNPDRPFVDVHDFVSRMRDFAEKAMPNFAENSGQLFDLLTDVGAISPHAIHDVLINFDQTEVRTGLDHFNAYLAAAAGISGLLLDPDTSDLMLIALIKRIPDRIRDALKGRAGRGKGRPSRLHRIAIRYFDQS
jgi:hypothetical protein